MTTEAEGAPRREPSWRRRVARSWVQISMLLAIALVFGAALWSSAIERRAALAEFSHEQAVLAAAVAVDFEHRLGVHLAETNPPRKEALLVDETVIDLLGGARRLEARGEVMVMVARPGQSGFLTTDRRMIPSSTLRHALDRGASDVTIPRDEAVAFGLPRRRAMAGLARVTLGSEESWGVVVLASAERLREREQHEWWRFGLTAVVVGGLVLVFGGMSLRRQRHELDLERQVAVSALEREREALLADADKMAALAALSTGIAHEVGTPLGVIVGRVEQVLDRSENDDRTRAALGIVLEQVARIQSIVRGCLALARGDSPAVAHEAPATLVEHAVGLVRHRFEKAAIEIVDHVAHGLPPIACDPSLFEQALVNVLLNACEATPRGGRVHVEVGQDDRSVVFVVDDDGPGITEAVARRATEPFFSTKRGQGGSGLGLTIAREIVSHHGGTLSVARRDEGGTRATISMPA